MSICSTPCAFAFAGVAGRRRTNRTNQLSHPASFAAAPPKYTVGFIRSLALELLRVVHEVNGTLVIEDCYTPAYELQRGLVRRVAGSARQGIEDQNRIMA